jgi:hypothetical protein
MRYKSEYEVNITFQQVSSGKKQNSTKKEAKYDTSKNDKNNVNMA